MSKDTRSFHWISLMTCKAIIQSETPIFLMNDILLLLIINPSIHYYFSLMTCKRRSTNQRLPFPLWTILFVSLIMWCLLLLLVCFHGQPLSQNPLFLSSLRESVMTICGFEVPFMRGGDWEFAGWLSVNNSAHTGRCLLTDPPHFQPSGMARWHRPSEMTPLWPVKIIN